MTGLSAFILTRFDRRAILRQLLGAAQGIAGAGAAFLRVDEGETLLGQTASGEEAPPEAFDPLRALADRVAASGRLERGGGAVAVPLVLQVGKDGEETGRVVRAVPPRLEELIGVLVLVPLEGEAELPDRPGTSLPALAAWISATIVSVSVAIEAQTDRLTGLLNRAAFARRLDDEIASCAAENRTLALMMVDIHHLDRINRTGGRDRGDALLRLLGRTLHERIRWRDIAARFGGDEFLAALPGASESAALAIAGRLRERFTDEARAAGLPPVAINVGVAVFPAQASGSALLLRHADQALTASKRLGPGRALAWREDYRALRERTDRLEGLLMADPAEDYERTLILLDTLSDVSSSEDSRPLLERLLDRILDVTGGERASLLRPGRDGELEAALSRDRAGTSAVPGPLGALPDVVERALLENEPASDAGALAVPLRAPGGAAGVVYVERGGSGTGGTGRASLDGDGAILAFLGALGHEAAHVLERHRLMEDLARGRREIEGLNRRLRARVEDQDRQITAIRGELVRARAPDAVGRKGETLLVAQSGPMMAALEAVCTAARTDAAVLLIGETGSGKELLARELHQRSPRRAGPFIGVNCTAIPQGLIESELFGHVRGAFTGAEREHGGLFEQANGGTLFLDEISSTSPGFQAKLLRVLQEGRIRRVGDATDREVDVRIVAAANTDLHEAIQRREFREDLYYRLAVFAVRVPPLRERPSDIPLLARAFLDEFAARALGRAASIVPEGLALLARHDWPGNVRELRNVMERLAATSEGETIGAEAVASALARHSLTGSRPGQPAGPRPGQAGAARELAAVPACGAVGDGGESRARALIDEMTTTGRSFWDAARTRYLDRVLTREDMRALIVLGLERSGGSYKKTAALFNLPPGDYKKFLDFLHNHDLRTTNRPARPTRVAAIA